MAHQFTKHGHPEHVGALDQHCRMAGKHADIACLGQFCRCRVSSGVANCKLQAQRQREIRAFGASLALRRGSRLARCGWRPGCRREFCHSIARAVEWRSSGDTSPRSSCWEHSPLDVGFGRHLNDFVDAQPRSPSQRPNLANISATGFAPNVVNAVHIRSIPRHICLNLGGGRGERYRPMPSGYPSFFWLRFWPRARARLSRSRDAIRPITSGLGGRAPCSGHIQLTLIISPPE